MGQNLNLLNQRLQAFRKKYYTNKLIRGSLLLALITTSILFVLMMSEAAFGFSSGVRTGMVYGLGAIFLGVLGYMVIWPVSQLANLSKTISDADIAQMIRRHFPEIDDKLINLLQLRQTTDQENSLLMAAIDSKASDIAPVPLSNAVNFNVNKKYIKYLAIPLLLFLITYAFNPQLLSSSTERLINFDKDFIPPPPFAIEIGNLPDEVVAGQDLKLDISVDGRELPAELFVYIKKNSENQFLNYNLKKVSATDFEYTLSDVKEDFTFYVGNPEVTSTEYEVGVLRRPFIKNFKVNINYPAYTGMGREALEDNVGDFKVIKGSTVTWTMEPQGDVESAKFVGEKTAEFKKRQVNEGFTYSMRLMENMDYFISLLSSEKIANIDTVNYHVDIVNDRHPSIYVMGPGPEYKVELDPTLPLEMEIADDFGFSKMQLFYRFTKSGGTNEVSQEFQQYNLSISKTTLLQPLSYLLDLTELGFSEGDEVEYYLKVWDNDGVSGPKASTSGTFKVVYPTLDEKYEEIEEDQEELKATMENAEQKSKELKEAYRKMQQKMLSKKNLSFDDREEIKKLLEEHQQMMEDMESIQDQVEEQKEKLQENQMISEKTLEMYEELNEYLEELNNPEIEEMLRELQEKMEDLNPEDVQEKLEDLEMNDEEIQESLERTKELFKQLEVQQKIDELKNKLEKLAAKQELLNEKLDNAKKDELPKLEEMQNELNEQMKDIQEEMEELGEMKKETSTPDKEKMEELNEEGEKTQDEMKDASEQMKNKQKKGASESQKDAAKKMKEMAKKLSQMQFDMQMQQDQQNLENLRELLENLLKLSFDQEDLRDEVKALKYGDPNLKEKGRSQKKLQDDMGLIQDSLQSLANQVFQIKQFVMDESKKIDKNMKSSQIYFRNKQVPRINYHQQLAMTSVNNLANMLSNVMDQIQQQMKSSMPGSGMCQKPGDSMNMQKLGQKQQQLNQMMQQMMGSGGVNPDKLAKMAAQQEAIRKQLQEMHSKIKKEGGKALGDMGKVMDDMKQTETDLVNKQLTHETLMRQQEILSRLLEADKSVRERDWDKERESQTGKVQEKKSPEELTLDEYKNRIRQEMLKSNKMEYSSDFIHLIEQYYQKLEETNE